MHDSLPARGRWRIAEPAQRKLVIVGAGEFADIACEYFTHDSPYEVVGFAVERAFLSERILNGLPVVPLEDVEHHFPPDSHCAFVAVTYTRLNRVRARLMEVARAKGYTLATYVSSAAFVWHNVELGDNVFIFEHNVIQHHVRIGSGAVLWSGNHIGHRSRIGSCCYLASHVVVSGYCAIGDYSFLGVNATLADHVTVGRDCVIGAGAVILKDTPPDSIYQATASALSRASSRRFFRVRSDE